MSDSSAMRLLGPASASRDYLPLLRLLLLLGAILFGFQALWYFGMVQAMLETDRSHISLLILAIYLLTTVHCGVQTVYVARELAVVRRIREAIEQEGGFAILNGRPAARDGAALEDGVLVRHIANLVAKSRLQAGRAVDQTLLLRALIDRLRSRERLGWFVSEGLLRLALLGTAVGFIFMLIPIAGLKSFDVETLRQALSGMSGGMAVALNVTVTGIGCALLLKSEYFLLDIAVAELFHEITEITEVYVVPVLERNVDG